MSQTELEKIVDRIRKLHAKAESAKEIGSLHEAEAFAAGVQKMLLLHKLEMETVTASGQVYADDAVGQVHVNWAEHGVENSHRRTGWIESLARGICVPLNCEFIVTFGSNRIAIVGRGIDRQIAAFLLGKLVAAAPRLADAAYAAAWKRAAQEGDVTAVRGYRKSWLSGFATGVTIRMRTEYAAAEAKNPGLGLIRVRDKALIISFMAKLHLRSGRSTTLSASHTDGYSAGRRVGERIDVKQTGVNGAMDRHTKQIKA